ncbi:MAG TPA: proline dehydrogenase family protein [Gemmatimonadales bacterium]
MSEQRQVFRFVRSNGLAKRFASRFVAGETLDTAVVAVRDLNARGISASLDLLGESVNNKGEAQAAADTAVAMLDRIAAEKLNSNISVKLTQLGLDLDHDLCVANARRVLDKARSLDTFVRIDMEGSAYTQRTLDLVEHSLFADYPKSVGVVIQSYLYRSTADIDRLIGLGMRVRLCKGAYKEPSAVAYPAKADVDRAYVALMEAMLSKASYPAIATHDEAMIARAKAYVKSQGIGAERFEFQMLYGVRRDLQDQLVAAGYRMRVYVPFGTQWYPYLMRRLAERPANIAFILGNVVKEGLK